MSNNSTLLVLIRIFLDLVDILILVQQLLNSVYSVVMDQDTVISGSSVLWLRTISSFPTIVLGLTLAQSLCERVPCFKILSYVTRGVSKLVLQSRVSLTAGE